ncbi:MAG: hypothetical protein RPT95_13300, partial [Candidatus Sedimenticola sp. (ex Thyasira tokunagai)]
TTTNGLTRFSDAYFVFPLALSHDGKTVRPNHYQGLTAFASLSMAVSDSPLSCLLGRLHQ